MDFSSGNSGNFLRAAVVKIGPGCQQEGAFCQHLTDRIAPEVFAIIPNGYVMEALLRPAITSFNLLIIETLLREHIWCREALPNSSDISWREKLVDFGIEIPDWVEDPKPCLAHGDPTHSNLLSREKRSFILADPRPPRDFVPQSAESDMGRILQSYLGWETAAYGWPYIEYKQPNFMMNPKLRKQAEFWCGAAAARIQYLEIHREPRPNGVRIVDWCERVRRHCGV